VISEGATLEGERFGEPICPISYSITSSAIAAKHRIALCRLTGSGGRGPILISVRAVAFPPFGRKVYLMARGEGLWAI
jgi:hypothetical protein